MYYGSTTEDLAEEKVDIGKLEEQTNLLEKKLSTLSNQFSAAYATRPVTYADVVAALKPSEAAIEIIRVPYSFGARKGDVEYVGLIARKGKTVPDMVRLPEGKAMEKGYLSFYKNAVKLMTADDRSYNSYWKPLAAATDGAQAIYVSVDGVYNSVNLNTLQLPDQSYVIDHARIVVVPSTRALPSLAGNTGGTLTGLPALLLGSPDFGDAKVVSPLPGTRIEVESIAGLLDSKQIPSRLLLGAEATEANMKSIKDPALLHIATHGYFLSDVSVSGNMTMGIQVSRARDNPLLRSGLLLAGAASAVSNEASVSGSNNGLLNAYEVMNLDLSETRLVVMSACETGTGEVVNGEGVYGLTRAFQVAGAQHIIMSLWKVDDTATEQLMTTFYREWLSSNDMQQAFISAQRIVKSKYPAPYYWGGFVLMN
jgi:CHAT domain-containing protein